ncbi:MAG: hypothetical protein PHI98_01070 [Eubacteriales bacterium]|nr:hypothetical protein [Eubacteriales bacterium]
MRKGISLPHQTLSTVWLGRICAVALILSLLPLAVIALYNYPADDDFGFTLDAARAWQSTGSLTEAAKAIVQKTIDTYNDWQGNFVSTALFGVNPLIFNINLYFISNWCILALLCLSVGYMVKGVTETLLHGGKACFWIVYAVFLTLIIQFMPSIGYSVYWHNGGMYTVAACTLFLLEGVLTRCLKPQRKSQLIRRCIWAALLGFMLGGSFFGPMLGAFVLVLLETIAAWVKRSKNRIPCSIALGFFLLSMTISLLAPGNELRQERTGEALSPLMSILTAALDSFDVAGKMMTPQLLGALLLILPTLWKPLKQSEYSFRHPFGVLVMFYGLFSATLVPGVYTGFGYTTERYYNVIYFYFLVMAVGSAIYATGSLIRYLERQKDAPVRVADSFGQRFTAGYLALCLGLFAFGGFGYTIMNTATLSATKSLLNGEAARFREEMAERQQYILVTDSDEVSVQPLSTQPYVFKADKLPWQGIYGRVRYMKWYFELLDTTQN